MAEMRAVETLGLCHAISERLLEHRSLLARADEGAEAQRQAILAVGEAMLSALDEIYSVDGGELQDPVACVLIPSPDDPQGQFIPSFHPVDVHAGRASAGEVYRTVYREMGAVAYAVVMEAWSSTAAAEDELRPSLAPDRVEQLHLCQVTAAGWSSGRLFQFPDPRPERVLDLRSLEVDPEIRLSGWLYDLLIPEARH